MMELLSSPEAWLSLVTLTAMEIVLGVDNIIFISILSSRLPPADRDKGRRLGLMGAFVSRLLLLLTISWIVGLVHPLFEVAGHPVSGKSIILFFGGLFLIWKATKEIHGKLEGDEEEHDIKGTVTLGSVLVQIALLDIVFSLDSVITAVGMSQHISIMVAANVIALGVMIFTSKAISNFVERHPTIKMLALSFLIMIGLVLVADAAGLHIPKGYIYFAMAFSVAVEMLNLRTASKKKKKAVKAK
ncbi:MAG TPA: TerC family protein [Oligoflexus sp.]|uniref:TerC family protein n=1 Tax=Oligoflexus sp. TaxID=1971216 RepID=UPI002D802830|nr:TerC family protein [Oligoflexus sp.]HET9240711.1 TerC family protein [Oligoflexus sp.]